jgi:hypothetical protein
LHQCRATRSRRSGGIPTALSRQPQPRLSTLAGDRQHAPCDVFQLKALNHAKTRFFARTPPFRSLLLSPEVPLLKVKEGSVCNVRVTNLFAAVRGRTWVTRSHQRCRLGQCHVMVRRQPDRVPIPVFSRPRAAQPPLPRISRRPHGVRIPLATSVCTFPEFQLRSNQNEHLSVEAPKRMCVCQLLVSAALLRGALGTRI